MPLAGGRSRGAHPHCLSPAVVSVEIVVAAGPAEVLAVSLPEAFLEVRGRLGRPGGRRLVGPAGRLDVALAAPGFVALVVDDLDLTAGLDQDGVDFVARLGDD